jgi:hypothetical protein
VYTIGGINAVPNGYLKLHCVIYLSWNQFVQSRPEV